MCGCIYRECLLDREHLAVEKASRLNKHNNAADLVYTLH